MRRARLSLVLGATLALAACGMREEGVYGEDLPEPGDAAAIEAIAQKLEGEDRYLWSNVTMRMSVADELGVESSSVRDAIENERNRVTCADTAESPAEQSKCSRWPI